MRFSYPIVAYTVALLSVSACGGADEQSAQAVGDTDSAARIGDAAMTASLDAVAGGSEGRNSSSEGTGPAVTPGCASDGDCVGADEICSCTGECTSVGDNAACDEPKNCGSDDWCNPCTRHCEARVGLCAPCSTSGLCGADGTCLAPADGACLEGGVCVPFASGGAFCGRPCLADAGCPSGYRCAEIEGADNKQCVPSSGSCDALPDACTSDLECPTGQKCIEGPQTCGPGCVDDTACPVGQVCSLSRCMDKCASDADCTSPALCDVESGKCRVPGECESWDNCLAEQYCDKATATCIDGCEIDDQCQDAAKVCEDGVCVEKGCAHHYQCSFEQECNAATGQCIPMTREHCAPCDASTQDPTQCTGEPNLCVSFQDEDGAALGDFCLLTCEDDLIDKCPQGYGCEQIQSPENGIDGFYCVRQCWVDPLAP